MYREKNRKISKNIKLKEATVYILTDSAIFKSSLGHC